MLWLLILAPAAAAAAAVELSFGDSFQGGAVLQRGSVGVTVWGQASHPGAAVSLSVDRIVVAHALASDDANATWSAVLPAHPSPSFDSVLSATSRGQTASVPVMWG